MHSESDYLARATEVLAIAERVEYVPQREALLEIYRQWLCLAERAVHPLPPTR